MNKRLSVCIQLAPNLVVPLAYPPQWPSPARILKDKDARAPVTVDAKDTFIIPTSDSLYIFTLKDSVATLVSLRLSPDGFLNERPVIIRQSLPDGTILLHKCLPNEYTVFENAYPHAFYISFTEEGISNKTTRTLFIALHVFVYMSVCLNDFCSTKLSPAARLAILAEYKNWPRPEHSDYLLPLTHLRHSDIRRVEIALENIIGDVVYGENVD